MKIVISPAKTLDFKTPLPTSRATQPQFLEKAVFINGKLSHKSKKAIKELMGISDTLAALNYQRYKDFLTPFTKENARPAVYAFAGDVYIGLDAYSIKKEKIDLLQDNLRILSGMYGVLRPLDLIQPYRLEMGTKLSLNRNRDLYGFWGNTITENLNQEMKDDEFLLNLASVEYFKVINNKKLKAPIISPVFKDFNKGELKLVSFFAKKARGSMARYVIDKNIKTIEGVKGFDLDGYAFSEKDSQNENEPVFVR